MKDLAESESFVSGPSPAWITHQKTCLPDRSIWCFSTCSCRWSNATKSSGEGIAGATPSAARALRLEEILPPITVQVMQLLQSPERWTAKNKSSGQKKNGVYIHEVIEKFGTLELKDIFFGLKSPEFISPGWEGLELGRRYRWIWRGRFVRCSVGQSINRLTKYWRFRQSVS